MDTFLRYAGKFMFAAAYFIVPAAVVLFIFMIARRTQPKLGHCVNCGTDLREVTGERCPACGRPFERDAHGNPMS